MVYSQAWQNLRTCFRILGEFAPPRVRNDEGSAKYLHTDYQALGSDLARITSKADLSLFVRHVVFTLVEMLFDTSDP